MIDFIKKFIKGNHPIKFLLPFLLLVNLSAQSTFKDYNISKLSSDPTWLKLLYYDEDTKKSEIISKEYFLAEDGSTNPENELKATLNAYLNMPEKIDDTHPVCLYPSRYHWLSKHVNLPSYRALHPQCVNLTKSINSIKVDSYSLVFVDGYLGNPASAFGHSFLKVNVKDANTNLFDVSVGYAAKVEDGENAFLYIMKGLFGGYDAQFSDNYYFTNDVTYLQKELRDIWEYKLNLSDEQKLFLSLHIYEITRQRFKYFFLNKNCGYEVAKLLEIVLKEPLVDNAEVWYAPIESFHKLREIDEKEDNNLIKEIIFHPSDQKLLYTKYKKLNTKEQTLTFDIINYQLTYQSESYKDLTILEKMNITNFVLSYCKYKIEQHTTGLKIAKLKKQTLLQRLKLPKETTLPNTTHVQYTPEMGDKPFGIEAALSHSRYQGLYSSLSLTPFSIESTGQNHINSNELVVLSANIGFFGSKQNIFIDTFDLIKIKKFKIKEMPFDTESNLSWDLHIGAKQVNDLSYDYFSRASLGKTIKMNEQMIFFALADVSLHTNKSIFRVLPKIGTRIDLAKLKSLFYFGYEQNFEGYNSYVYTKADISYSIKKNLSLKFDYEKYESTKISIGLKFFF